MRYLPVIVASSLVAAAAVFAGLRTDRWGAAPNLGAAAARLQQTPMKIGDWEGQPIELDARQLTVAEVTGHIARRYVHRRTGEETTVVVLCGRPGPISVHSPEVCYPGAGFNLVGDATTFSTGGDGRPAADFFHGRFVKPGAVPEALDVAWAWKANGPWTASDNPRVAFAQASVLYKIYIIHRLAHPDDKLPEDSSRDFLPVFLPELDKYVGPAS
ncbi:MAG TPA: exosortase-associated EpsI family protein [Gemmataceae bacterium]|nr:exosortase-associated EpsI family protein [Gemmataceae bacterium]